MRGRTAPPSPRGLSVPPLSLGFPLTQRFRPLLPRHVLLPGALRPCPVSDRLHVGLHA